MTPWSYEPAVDLDQSMVERLRHFPRQPDMLVYGLRSSVALALRGWLCLYHRLEITGVENLPQDGSFVLVANHTSHLDTLCLLTALPLRKLHRAFPAAAKDYFFVDIPRMAMAAIVVNALPFGRQSQIRQSLGLCRELLANAGNILILFPEGTRTVTGEIGEFRPGIGMLIGGTSIPIVPCYLDGAFKSLPKGRIFPLPSKIELRIGSQRTFAGLPPGKETAERICTELRRAVMDLAG
jgi:1-acyl-sn-glycerol-3-phosphate acyltransferase